MLVGDRMSSPVLTITADVPVQDALARMRKEKVRRYPVVDKKGKLIGIITDSDLTNAKPSDATTLSIWEINYLLTKITVERVMSKNVITTTEDCPIEEAARVMADNEISSLPVMRNGSLVGMITETDLFNILLEVMGARSPGVRLTVEVLNTPGKLYELIGIIHRHGGDILGLGAILSQRSEMRILAIKVAGVPLETLREEIRPAVEKMIDIRETNGE